MKYLCLALLVFVLVDSSMGYCYSREFEGVNKCIAAVGLEIESNGIPVELPGRCEKCSCKKVFSDKLVMSCCGYGINAGIMMPPPGCKIVTEDDGCTPKIVQLADETRPC